MEMQLNLPEGVAPMPAEKRAELKQLAQAATPGPWQVCDRAEHGCCYEQQVETVARIRHSEGHELPYGERVAEAFGEDVPYFAALPPEIVLGTLAYVEALETQLATQVQEHKKNLKRLQELFTDSSEWEGFSQESGRELLKALLAQ